MTRTLPSILITGTPGCGKTTLSSKIATLYPEFQHIDVSQLVKEKELHDGLDKEFDSLLFDEDKVIDELESVVPNGGCIVDFHSCDFFPETWFDLVIVLRSDNTVLYDRLAKRNYSVKKITENIECEIMQVVLDEAMDAYAKEMVVELNNNTTEDMDSNVDRIMEWIKAFQSK
ncbi:putative adenylate kinase isoenzyme 6 [Rozella allomycis CSF55]|uniref:Adenylate kinase isoenzyme 6 homolog n=1 Tax=Rozella allomycis (strain CSF55) TaxID=988480 RepID=A0A075B081_ROZAC|nr:AAA domain-containing protein [Rozella allomycis CSF55]RKP21650.1 putative adenylate kinase isoenzyme 6 [Rozella allomycis CSF55]|eukprot:EPZ34364.1 AAA domain-containing protein [Rozella allomycis CSF55]